jgi:hypothetical protein
MRTDSLCQKQIPYALSLRSERYAQCVPSVGLLPPQLHLLLLPKIARITSSVELVPVCPASRSRSESRTFYWDITRTTRSRSNPSQVYFTPSINTGWMITWLNYGIGKNHIQFSREKKIVKIVIIARLPGCMMNHSVMRLRRAYY